MSALLLLAIGLVCYASFICFALTLPEHWEQLGGRPGHAPGAYPLRATGAGLLAFALALCLWRDGAGFGSLLWMLLISVAALAVAFTLSWCATRRADGDQRR